MAKKSSVNPTKTDSLYLVVAVAAIISGVIFITNYGDPLAPANDGNIFMGGVLLLVGGLLTGIWIADRKKG